MPTPALSVRAQVGALVYRRSSGFVEVLLVTSRDTGRWVIPKGWRMRGKSDAAAATIEARQEAGVVCKGKPHLIGGYDYFKRQPSSFDACRVTVFLCEFKAQLPRWKEQGQRELRWVAPAEAATMVEEPGLSDLLLRLSAPKLKKLQPADESR